MSFSIGKIKPIYFIVLLAFLFRIMVYIGLDFDRSDFGDTAHYVQTGRNVAEGRGFTIFSTEEVTGGFMESVQPPSGAGLEGMKDELEQYYYSLVPYGEPFAFWDPLWPHIIALFLLLGDSGLAVLTAAGCAIGAFTCYLIYRLGEAVFNRTTGLAAAAIMAVDFNSVFYSSILMTETISIMLLMSAFLMFYRIVQRPDNIQIALLGVIIGLSYLQRANFLILLPVIVVFLFFALKRRFRIRSLLVLLGFVLISAPWWTRNAVETGHVWMLPSKGAFNLWKTYASVDVHAKDLGLNTRRDLEASCKRVEAMVNYPEALYLSSVDGETEYDRAGSMRDLTQKFISENPGISLKRSLRQLAGFYSPFLHAGSRVQRLYMFAAFVFIFGIGMIGAAAAVKHRKNVAVILGFVVLFSLAGGLFRLGYRFRMPVMPFFMLFTGYVVSLYYEPVKDRVLKILGRE